MLVTLAGLWVLAQAQKKNPAHSDPASGRYQVNIRDVGVLQARTGVVMNVTSVGGLNVAVVRTGSEDLPAVPIVVSPSPLTEGDSVRIDWYDIGRARGTNQNQREHVSVLAVGTKIP